MFNLLQTATLTQLFSYFYIKCHLFWSHLQVKSITFNAGNNENPKISGGFFAFTVQQISNLMKKSKGAKYAQSLKSYHSLALISLQLTIRRIGKSFKALQRIISNSIKRNLNNTRSWAKRRRKFLASCVKKGKVTNQAVISALH